ncbi:hypothetical protein B0H10DRAFT_1945596 [Mycena sp. CBHHK59/15]|nr:hypothetical protein B0H10DRAFT_1945596 [Mycena sp. CBHHK59/15]
MPYLRAFINETLRLYVQFSSVQRRWGGESEAGGDRQRGGEVGSVNAPREMSTEPSGILRPECACIHPKRGKSVERTHPKRSQQDFPPARRSQAGQREGKRVSASVTRDRHAESPDERTGRRIARQRAISFGVEWHRNVITYFNAVYAAKIRVIDTLT